MVWVSTATRAAINQHLAASDFFWLDLKGVDDEAHDILLNDFKVHHLAVDDAQHFGQRPKVEDYDNFTYMVVHGASSDQTATDEVHFIFAEHFVITVHHGCLAMDEVRKRVGHRKTSELESPQSEFLSREATRQVADGKLVLIEQHAPETFVGFAPSSAIGLESSASP